MMHWNLDLLSKCHVHLDETMEIKDVQKYWYFFLFSCLTDLSMIPTTKILGINTVVKLSHSLHFPSNTH